ncbi:MAG: Gldg family protein [Planctomycetota bacterium]
MKAGRILAGAILLALLLGIGAFAVRVARHYRGARAELAQFKITQLDPATKQRLHTLKDKVFLTYFVNSRAELPSHMRGLERSVKDLFDAMKAEAKGLLDYQIIDPSDKKNQDIARYASNRKISPVRVRSVARDSYSEKIVWSGVSVSYGVFPPAIINGIEPEHLERLQSLIVSHLIQMENPRMPTVAIAAPNNAANYKELIAALSEPDKNTKKVRAKVVVFDFAGGAKIPADADLLFWFEPGHVDSKQIRELNLFLENGRCAIVAGSEYDAIPTGNESGLQLEVKKLNYDSEPLLSEFGLQPIRELVLDQNCGELIAGANNEKVAAPYLLRVIGYNQDFRVMRGQPNGTLLFVTPTCMSIDAERLSERRWTADLLVTTSDKTWVNPIPASKVNVKDLVIEKGEPVAKLPIMVGLRHASPWHGSIIFSGAVTPFVDGWHKKENTAHWRLLKVLVDSLASDERLVQIQVGKGRLAPIPELTSSERLLWRSICVFLFAGGLGIIAFARGGVRSGTGESGLTAKARSRDSMQIVLRGIVGFGAAIVLVIGARAVSARVDLTHENINKLAPETAELAASMGSDVTKVELIFSSHEQLPPAMRSPVRRARDVVREIRRAGANLQTISIEPDGLDTKDRAALEASGVTPFQTTTQDEETTVARTVYSAIRITKGERTETLQFPDVASFENLEFRFAFAMWRIQTGKTAHVAFASDIPRLTPAEDWDFSQANLLAPKGADVYSVAREIVKGCDFRVTHVNPREPVIPNDVDLLVWFQPRRDVSKMYEALATYLHNGGKAILAAQHFNMQSRQYRGGKNFKIVYWPQPQFNDVDHFYFPDLGIQMVSQVLFDDLKTRMELESQVFRSAIKEYKPMESALPFLIRASAASYATDSNITKNLGDQALLFASFLKSDETRLRELGITAKPLMFTSPRSWSYAWTGGWIPDELLTWPPSDPKPEGDVNPLMPAREENWSLNPRVPLAVLYEGNFPESGPLSLQSLFPASQPESRERPSSKPSIGGAPGKLLMIGCSETFKNYRILHNEFRGSQFLLNAVSSLALNEKLANVAVRRPVSRGFDIEDSDTKIFWRVFVLCAFPGIFVLFGIIFQAIRAGSPVRTSA